MDKKKKITIIIVLIAILIITGLIVFICIFRSDLHKTKDLNNDIETSTNEISNDTDNNQNNDTNKTIVNEYSNQINNVIATIESTNQIVVSNVELSNIISNKEMNYYDFTINLDYNSSSNDITQIKQELEVKSNNIAARLSSNEDLNSLTIKWCVPALNNAKSNWKFVRNGKNLFLEEFSMDEIFNQ